MDQAKLGIAMKNISRYFGKPEPKGDTLTEWMKELHYIPNEPVDWIEQKIKANKYPDNPPQAIRKLWYQWLEEHPDRQKKEEAGCDECEAGFLYASKKGYSFVFRCEHCNSFGESSVLVANRTRLELKGFKLNWIHLAVSEIKELPEFKIGVDLMKRRGIIGVSGELFKAKDVDFDDIIPF